MQVNNKGKYRALLGVLVVFFVPFVVVSTVYLSSKPKTVTLEKFYDDEPFMNDLYQTILNENIDFTKLDKDIKVLFYLNHLSLDKGFPLIKNIYEETLTYPERDFKDPFPKVLFVAFQNLEEKEITQPGDKNFFLLDFQTVQDSIIFNRLLEQKIILLGRDNRVRGEYDYTGESFKQLKKDLQNLMAETYFVNKKTERERRLKKKL